MGQKTVSENSQLELLPLSKGEAEQIQLRVSQVFTPRTPVTVRELFSGRTEQIIKVLDALGQIGLHAILYGERGVGKTSLANIIEIMAGAGSANRTLTCKVNCEGGDTFESVWKKALSEFKYNSSRRGIGFTAVEEGEIKRLSDHVAEHVDANSLRLLFAAAGTQLLIIFDEFDRLSAKTSRAFTDVIKTLSDTSAQVTLLLVGVADTVDRLIKDHASVSRALVQIHMPRMQTSELTQIIATGSQKLGVTFDPGATAQIVHLSQGLPHYTHLVSRNAVRKAVARMSRCVSSKDVEHALKDAVGDAQHSIKTQYHNAVSSSHKSARFREVLLACAIAKKDGLSYFQAADVAAPLSKILGKPYEIPAFARHLSKLCEPGRSAVLEKTGERRRYRYRFTEPLLEPFIIMSGLADHLISPSLLATLTAK
jgi:Cdc6-like AAA superfamily ATPase